jgi:zinc and cadmium transporter
MILFYIIIFSVLGSIGAIIVAALFLTFPNRIQFKLLPGLISYATGALLGAAFIRLIPHSLELLDGEIVMSVVLLGIVIFFILEKLVLWRHCHKVNCEVHDASGPLILIGDAFHNFVDGVVITAAFLVSIPVGIATSISIISHEIPQEVGDFAILINNKYSKMKAFGLNIIAGFTSLIGALAAYFFMLKIQSSIGYIMALSASSFIYIAIGDLMPGLSNKNSLKQTISQVFLLLCGIGTIIIFNHH